MNTQHLISLLLLNIPAYICGALALWRKNRDENFYAAGIFAFLLLTLLVEAVAVSQTTYIETATPVFIQMEAIAASFIIPFIYLFHAPEGGLKVTRTIIFLFLAILIFLFPTTAWELSPGYAILQDVSPRAMMGISLYYKGQFFYHVTYTSIILVIQSYIALSQLNRLYRLVQLHGGKYSWKAKVTYYWNFSCGYFLALSFFFPLSFWQHPTTRWTYYIISTLFIALGCLLVFLGFDINPVVDSDNNNFSLGDFMLENGQLVTHMKQLLEDEQVYLEPGIQSETVAQRLDTAHPYFLKMMQATYGCSFPEWVNRQRIAHAKQLFQSASNQNTALPSFDEVASACGYPNTFAFLRMFMRVNNGQTASEYCRSLGNTAPIYTPQTTYDDD